MSRNGCARETYFCERGRPSPRVRWMPPWLAGSVRHRGEMTLVPQGDTTTVRRAEAGRCEVPPAYAGHTASKRAASTAPARRMASSSRNRMPPSAARGAPAARECASALLAAHPGRAAHRDAAVLTGFFFSVALIVASIARRMAEATRSRFWSTLIVAGHRTRNTHTASTPCPGREAPP